MQSAARLHTKVAEMIADVPDDHDVSDLDLTDQSLEAWANACTLDLRVDAVLTAVADRVIESDRQLLPWLATYAAMQQRLVQPNANRALPLAQQAHAAFVLQNDVDGQTRALAEIGIARYLLGQRAMALAELTSCPLTSDPACIAALTFAVYLNKLGLDDLPGAIEALPPGLAALDRETNAYRRAVWRVTIQRNAIAAYHYNGQLQRARAAAREVLDLIDAFPLDVTTRLRTLYEVGVLEHRAGNFDTALSVLQQARDLAEHAPYVDPFERWVVVAQAHVLRDRGRFAEADQHYRLGGWGEGDEGPLWLWFLQGRHADARQAAEARLAAAYAIGSRVEMANFEVFFALLDFETDVMSPVEERLREAAATFAELGFLYNHASVHFHRAAVEYAHGNTGLGDQYLATALQWGATEGYLNFRWWHPVRMQNLLRHALAHNIEPAYSARLLEARGLSEPINVVLACAEQIQPATQRIELCCFGRFEVRIDGRALPAARWRGQPAGAIRMQRLLLHLARHRAPQSIDAIGRYVWPDHYDQIDVTANVHVTLTGLRRVLEPDLQQRGISRYILTTPHGYQLNPALDVSSDLDRLDGCVLAGRQADASGDKEAARAAYEQAEQIYSGPFAPGKPDPNETDVYHAAVAHAIRWLAADDLVQGDAQRALLRARRLVREDQWDHQAWYLLISAYLAQGNRRTARRYYERYLSLFPESDVAMQQLANAHKLR